jgi:quercetin dioxygenase-like cupin family protein
MNTRSLSSLSEEHLALAKDSSSGRSAVTIFGGQEHDMRQTLIALAGGSRLHEHDSPGEATLQVLSGDVRLTTDGDAWDGTAGDYLVIPPERHGLEAVTDAVVLLTVATRA